MTSARRKPVFAAALSALLLAACGGGGGGGGGGPAAGEPLGASNLAVLVAAGDATSEAIGAAYVAARGIPAANVIRLTVPTDSDAISAAAFATVKAELDAKLPATAQATLVTWARPSRVQGSTCSMGLTSALAFGYDAKYCGGCRLTAVSPYYHSSSRRPWDDHHIRPSMMLGASTLAAAQTLIARGVAADASLSDGAPVAQAWLVRTNDFLRSARWQDFQQLAALVLPGLAFHYVDNNDSSRSNLVTNQNDVMFYFTGLVTVPQVGTNHWLPGAVGDNLTSLGGVLPSSGNQMPATAWLDAGATASYGNVEEPCNHEEKFARASVLVAHYVAGETLIEAYWKSVQWPGQGLFVGEPLAQPWKR
jgi:uncharacterized protein (TIGR03790 family)